MTTREDMRAALKPTSDALLRAAADDARAVLQTAEAEADRRLAEADAEAEHILAQARSEGERDARYRLDVERRDALREARALVLQAQRDVYDELVRQVRVAAQEFRADPAYPQLLEGLAATVQERLGPAAVATEAPSGGVLGALGSRLLDLSLDELAERALAACPEEVRSLWQP